VIDWRDPDARAGSGVNILAVVRWTVAVAIIALAHAGAIWIVLHWKATAAAPAEPAAPVMIELAPLAVSPEAAPQEVAPGPQMTEAQPDLTPDAPETPTEEPRPDPVPDQQQTAAVDETRPRAPEPEIKVPELPPAPNAAAVLTPPLPQPKPKPKRPRPKPVQKVEPRQPVHPEKQRVRQTSAPPISQARRSNIAAAPSASASPAPSVSPASWRGSLMAHLNRYKRFPAGAAGAGTATVAFTINRSGAVIGSRLVGSSGDRALDADAVALPRRASPVPAPPANVGGGSITLSVPIRFSR